MIGIKQLSLYIHSSKSSLKINAKKYKFNYRNTISACNINISKLYIYDWSRTACIIKKICWIKLTKILTAIAW